MAKYRKKPVEVEAFQWTGDVEALKEWFRDIDFASTEIKKIDDGRAYTGYGIVEMNDWLMLSLGSRYGLTQWDKFQFEATYEAVGE